MSKQQPKIYISPLLLKELHTQYSTAANRQKSENDNSTVGHSDNLSDFCAEATRIFSEALIVKLDAKEVNKDILVRDSFYSDIKNTVLINTIIRLVQFIQF